MSAFSVTLPSGESWTPQFVQELNEDTCIGCGRCFKVCPRGVLELFGVNEDGDKLALSGDDDEDEEYEKKVMTIAHQELCIGCTACSKVCPKKCYTHGPVEA